MTNSIESSLEQTINHYVNEENGLLHFAEDILSGFLSKLTPDFHREIYTLLTTKNRLALAAPRSFAKSTIVSVIYPIYVTLFKIKKDIVIISASETLAVEWLRKIKNEYLHNDVLRAFYVRIWGKEPPSSKWSENHIILSNGVNIRGKGAEAQIRGFRPDLFLCDDIESDEGVRSEERRRHLKEWFEKAVIGTLDPSGQLVIIGTILHFLSLLNHLIEEAHDFGWQTKLFTAYEDGIQEPGHELWVAKWNHEDLQKRKAEIGSFAFSSEYMNNPVPEDAAAFKKDYLKYFTDLPPVALVQVFDPAYTENETSDYKAVSIIGKDSIGNRYLEHYIRTHRPMNDYLSMAVNQYKGYRPQVVALPSGAEKHFYNSVVEFYAKNGCHPVFVELKNVATSQVGVSIRKKEARIVAALQGLFQGGKYYLRKDQQEAIDELLTFPAGKHDDILDTMAGAEQCLMETYVESEADKQYVEEMLEQEVNRGTTGYE